MPPNHQFEYLPLLLREHGTPRPSGRLFDEDATRLNRVNRAAHSKVLGSRAFTASANWQSQQAARAAAGLPVIPAGIPLLLKIDPTLDIDDLRRFFNFEIVSEQADGFVIVASEDIDLADFQQRVTGFAAKAPGSGSVAKIHELREDATQEERLQQILSEMLLQEWADLDENATYICDIGISCTGTAQIPPKPVRRKREKDESWAARQAAWTQQRSDAYQKWDDLKDERLAVVFEIIGHYGGEVLLDIDDAAADAPTLPDSFTLRLKLPVKGLKDLVLNYAYIFEVAEPDDIETPQQYARQYKQAQAQLELVAPQADAPAVCVIDSGIQEAHFLLELAIDKESSHCFLSGRPADVNDHVPPGGHGTRVAGAVLHGEELPASGKVLLDYWIQNARVLDEGCNLPSDLFPPVLLREIVKRFHEGPRKTRIFNHSINADAPCRSAHMSAWAAEIDRLSHDYNILVIQSIGNLKPSRAPPRQGVAELVAGGHGYPAYLDEAVCRVANPAQSFQALTVGSVAYGGFNNEEWQSLASLPGEPSAFSRCGLGMWGAIKPEVVEFGGDYLRTLGNPPLVGTPAIARERYPELVRSTMHPPGPAFDRDEVGTSYATPKVARIAARLQALLPDKSCLLYRGLIVQSARWPAWADERTAQQRSQLLRHIGYGIPDMERATANTNFRTTFITHDDCDICAGDCNVYQVPIPLEIRGPADEFDILIEVTLSYVAEPRRTRRTHRGYLSTWLDWISNGREESLDHFIARALKTDDEPPRKGSSSGWVIESRTNWGLPGVRRDVGTVQKDWALYKSNELPEDFCIAVRGHPGWSHDPESVASYSLVVTFEILGQEIPIYDPLRAAVLELEAELGVEAEVAEAEFEAEG